MTETPPLHADLVPAKVQKAWVDDDVLLLDLFAGSRRLLEVRPGQMREIPERSTRDLDGVPPALQGQVRKELVPSILSAIEVRDFGVTSLLFRRKGAPDRRLLIEADGRDPRWFLLASVDDGERILACVPGHKPRDGRDTRRGRLYEAPRHAPTPMPAPDAPPARALFVVDEELQTLRARLRAEHERLRRLQKALERDIAKHQRGGGPDHLQHQGELLKTRLHTLKRGLPSIDIDDGLGQIHTIPLDPRRSPQENLAQIFARARRGRAGLAHLAPRVTDADARLAVVDGLRKALAANTGDVGGDASGDADNAVDAVTDEARAAALALLSGDQVGASARRRAATATGRRQPWRNFRVHGDVIVRVGRGAKDNDALVKSARGHDLWLHTRDRTGAHVIIASAGGQIPEEVLLDAAHLAAWFSSGRGERHLDIQSTRVKHLRKPGAGAPAGLFLVANENVMHLRVDDDRVQRLLTAEVAVVS